MKPQRPQRAHLIKKLCELSVFLSKGGFLLKEFTSEEKKQGCWYKGGERTQNRLDGKNQVI